MSSQKYVLDVPRSSLPYPPRAEVRGDFLGRKKLFLEAVRQATWMLNFRPESSGEDHDNGAGGRQLSFHVRQSAEARLEEAPLPSWTEVATDKRGTVWQMPDGVSRRVPVPTGPESFGGLLLWEEECSAELLVPSDVCEEAKRSALFEGIRLALINGLPRLGWVPLHAALLAAPSDTPISGGVLLVGPSGSGKSTLTAGAMLEGWKCVSDDQVLLSPRLQPKASTTNEGESQAVPGRAWRLAPTLRLRTDAWDRLGLHDTALGAAASRVKTERARKWSVRLSELEDSKPTCATDAAAPMRIVAVSITDHSQSRLRSCSPADVLPAVLGQSPPTAVLPTQVGRSQTRRLGALLRRAECYQLAAGHDLYKEPGRLADFLSRSALSQETKSEEEAATT